MLEFLNKTPNISNLESALKVSSLRHNVISNNIANVNTPFFKRSEVVFEAYLKDYLESLEGEKAKKADEKKLPLKITNGRHIDNKPASLEYEPYLGAMVKTVDGNIFRTDGNNVDIDIEMAEMAKNSIYYQAVAQRLGGYFSNLRTVIEGR